MREASPGALDILSRRTEMIPRIRKKYLMQTPVLFRDILIRGRYSYTFDLMPFTVRNMDFRKRWNLFLSGMNLLYRKSRPWSFPTFMNVELTNVCNLQCPVCPTGAGLLRRKKEYIDLGLFERLMEETSPHLLMVMLWGWGEPLLHPSFHETVRIARSHGVLPLLSTNGQLLEKEDVREKLLAHPPECLIVAIDGLTDETNSRYRVGSKMEPVLEGVRRLTEERRRLGQESPHLNMRYIVMKHNEEELDRVEGFARRHGFDSLSIRSLSTVENRGDVQRNMAPSKPEWRAYEYRNGRRMKRETFSCHIAFTCSAVFADGSVVVCDQDAHTSQVLGRFGNGRSFKNIWFGKEASSLRKVIRKKRDRIGFCRECPYADRDSNTCNIAFKHFGN
jgi:radical SAM protein with 4Fe4S-binding SPASM domain